MTTSNVAAQVLVHAYLDGRSMDEFMFAATVRLVDKRLARGIAPALDQMLRDDIDGQAGAVAVFSSSSTADRTSERVKAGADINIDKTAGACEIFQALRDLPLDGWPLRLRAFETARGTKLP